MIFWDFMERLSCYTVMWQVSDVFIEKLLGDSLRFQKGMRRLNLSACVTCRMLIVVAAKCTKWYQGYTLDSGSVVFLHTSTKKGMKNKRQEAPFHHTALCYTIFHSLVLTVVLQFTQMTLSVQIKDCFSLLEVCNMFYVVFNRLLTHLRYPLLLKGPKLWETEWNVANLSQSSHQIVVRYPSTQTFKDSSPCPARFHMLTAFYREGFIYLSLS